MMIRSADRSRMRGISLRDVGVVAIALAVFAIITSIVIGMIYLVDLMR